MLKSEHNLVSLDGCRFYRDGEIRSLDTRMQCWPTKISRKHTNSTVMKEKVEELSKKLQQLSTLHTEMIQRKEELENQVTQNTILVKAIEETMRTHFHDLELAKHQLRSSGSEICSHLSLDEEKKKINAIKTRIVEEIYQLEQEFRKEFSPECFEEFCREFENSVFRKKDLCTKLRQLRLRFKWIHFQDF